MGETESTPGHEHATERALVPLQPQILDNSILAVPPISVGL